jgi:hypothetical protein
LAIEGFVPMTDLIIHCHGSSTSDCCALCGDQTDSGDGPQLLQADSLDVVCRKCGKEHAPGLVALLDLACTATRVGRISRHTLVPPLSALLDLARAAEDYTLTNSANGAKETGTGLTGRSRRRSTAPRLYAAAC